MLMEMTPDSAQIEYPKRYTTLCVNVCVLAGNEFESSSCLSIMRLACSIGSQLQVTSGIIIALVEPVPGQAAALYGLRKYIGILLIK